MDRALEPVATVQTTSVTMGPPRTTCQITADCGAPFITMPGAARPSNVSVNGPSTVVPVTARSAIIFRKPGGSTLSVNRDVSIMSFDTPSVADNLPASRSCVNCHPGMATRDSDGATSDENRVDEITSGSGAGDALSMAPTAPTIIRVAPSAARVPDGLSGRARRRPLRRPSPERTIAPPRVSPTAAITRPRICNEVAEGIVGLATLRTLFDLAQAGQGTDGSRHSLGDYVHVSFGGARHASRSIATSATVAVVPPPLRGAS